MKRTVKENDNGGRTARTCQQEQSLEPLQIRSTFLMIFLVSCVTQLLSALILMVRGTARMLDVAYPMKFSSLKQSSSVLLLPLFLFLLMSEKPFRIKLKQLLLCHFGQKKNSNFSERCRSNDTGPRELSRVNIVSFMSESASHEPSASYRSRSRSFPETSQSKNDSSASFFQQGYCTGQERCWSEPV